MSHRRARKLLNAYLDGELEERERKLVEEHLKACSSCSKELEALKAIDEMVKTRTTHRPSEEYWKTLPARVRSRIIAEQERAKPVWSKGLFPLKPVRLKLISTLAVVVLVALVGRHYLFQRIPERLEMGRWTEGEMPGEEVSDAHRAIEPKMEEVAKLPAKEAAKKREVPAPKGELGEETGKLREKTFEARETPPLARKLPPTKPGVPEEKVETLYDMAAEAPPKELEERAVAGAVPETESLSSSARFELAHSQQMEGDYDDAIRNYNLVIVENEKLAPSAQFQVNLLQAAVRDTGLDEEVLRRKTDMWRSFVEDYPETELISDAYRNYADNAYQLSRLTQKREDIELAIAAAKSCLDFIKEGKTAEYYNHQLIDLQRDLEKLK